MTSAVGGKRLHHPPSLLLPSTATPAAPRAPRLPVAQSTRGEWARRAEGKGLATPPKRAGKDNASSAGGMVV